MGYFECRVCSLALHLTVSTSQVPYRIRYATGMNAKLITEARRRAGLTGAELARRSGTSRPTLSAYEHGRVSPTLHTVERVLRAAGHHLDVVRTPRWQKVPVRAGRTANVPDTLPRLAAHRALRKAVLPIHLDWSKQDRTVDFADRPQRHRAYEAILREGRPADIESFVDGVLLVDAWEDIVLPRPIKTAWQPLIDEVTTHE